MLAEFTLSEVEIDWAVRRNRHFAVQLGWGRAYPGVFRLLGLGSLSARERHHFSPRALAVRIATWQRGQPGLTPNGVLGPESWARMKPMLGGTPNAPVPATRAEPLGALVSRRESRVTEAMQIALGQQAGRHRLSRYEVKLLPESRATTRLVSSTLPFPTRAARDATGRWTNWCQLRIGAIWLPVQVWPWKQDGERWTRQIRWTEYEYVATETWLMRGYRSVAHAPGWLYLSRTGRPSRITHQAATGRDEPALDQVEGVEVPGLSRGEKLAWTMVTELALSTTKFVALGRGVSGPQVSGRVLDDLGSDGGQQLIDATLAAVMGAIAGDAFTDLTASSVWLVDIVPAPTGNAHVHHARHG